MAWGRVLEPAIAEVRKIEGEQLWSGIGDLVAVVRRWEARHDAANAMIGTAPVEALTETLIRRETSRLMLMRDAAAGVIPGAGEPRPQGPVPGA